MDLLDAWRNGDRTAGNELFEAYFPALYRFFANKVCDGVDDLIQQTLMACVEGRDRFTGSSSFRAYLFGVARNTLFVHYRNRHKAGRFDAGVTSLHDLDPSPSRLLAQRAEERLLAAALREIPADAQIAVELHYWEGLTTAELAEALGIPHGTVKSRLRRAKEQLREKMAELAASESLLTGTLSDVDRWASNLRTQLPQGPDDGA